VFAYKNYSSYLLSVPYYIRYRKDGKLIEEKVGRQYQDGQSCGHSGGTDGGQAAEQSRGPQSC
jgi:hypothetical protein